MRTRFLVLAFLLLLGSFSYGQTQEKTSPIDVKAAKVEYSAREGVELTRFSGGVVFTTPKIKISAHEVELYGSGDKIIANQQVEIYFTDTEDNRQGEAFGGSLEYNRQTGYLLITKNPVLKLHSASDADNPTTRDIEIKAEKLEMWVEENRALASGNVVITQPDFQGGGDRAEFFTLDEKVILTGSPWVTRGENAFNGEKITIYAKTGRMVIEGSVSGQISGQTGTGQEKPAAEKKEADSK